MFGEMLAFLVGWVATFAIVSIIYGFVLAVDHESGIIRRAAKTGAALATLVTAIGIVLRLAKLALEHIPL